MNIKIINTYLIIFLLGVLIVFIGAGLNLVVFHYNGGKMPVYNELNVFTDDYEHFVYYDKREVNLSKLSDIYLFSNGEGYTAFSIGDTLLFLGICLCLSALINSTISLIMEKRRYKGMK